MQFWARTCAAKSRSCVNLLPGKVSSSIFVSFHDNCLFHALLFIYSIDHGAPPLNVWKHGPLFNSLWSFQLLAWLINITMLSFFFSLSSHLFSICCFVELQSLTTFILYYFQNRSLLLACVMFPGECLFLPNDNAYVPINQFMVMLHPFFKLIHACSTPSIPAHALSLHHCSNYSPNQHTKKNN